MPDLVAEVSENGPIRLSELQPDELAVGIVGLRQVEGDDSVLVARRHFVAA